jgi:hypothetical protein
LKVYGVLYRMREDEIEKYYNAALSLIEKCLGVGVTRSYELDSVGHRIFGKKYRGTFARDMIPKMEKGDYCIINVDTTKQTGSHWVGIYKSNKYNIYDSFGRSSKSLLHMKGVFDADYDAEQHALEENCGQRSLAWLYCVSVMGIEEALKI